MTWTPIDSPPPMHDVEFWEGKRSSDPVLGVGANGRQLVVTFEGYEDEAPAWFTNCSEHWRVDEGFLVAWQPLPPPPPLKA